MIIHLNHLFSFKKAGCVQRSFFLLMVCRTSNHGSQTLFLVEMGGLLSALILPPPFTFLSSFPDGQTANVCAMKKRRRKNAQILGIALPVNCFIVFLNNPARRCYCSPFTNEKTLRGILCGPKSVSTCWNQHWASLGPYIFSTASTKQAPKLMISVIILSWALKQLGSHFIKIGRC